MLVRLGRDSAHDRARRNRAELKSLPALASFSSCRRPGLRPAAASFRQTRSRAARHLYRDDFARAGSSPWRTSRRSQALLKALDVPFLVVEGPGPRHRRPASGPLLPRSRSGRPAGVVRDRADRLRAGGRCGRRCELALLPRARRRSGGSLSTNVDLHWHFLFSSPFGERRTSAWRTFSSARAPRPWTAPSVSTPDRADTLIHLALHACLEGGKRLVWLKDIEQAVVNDRPPWSEVVERALFWRVNLLVGTMLMRSRAALAAPVPDDVIRALVPNRGWRALLGSLDRTFPVTTRRRLDTPATLAAKVTRTDVKDDVGIRCRRMLARRVRRRRPAEPARSDSSAKTHI